MKETKKKIRTITSYNKNKYFYRQEPIISYLNENDQRLSIATHSTMESSYEYSQMSNEDSTQPFNVDEQYQYSDSYQAESIDLQTVPECYTEDNNYQSIDVYPTSHSWEQSCGETLGKNHLYHNSSQSDLTTTKMRNIESAQNDATLKYNQDIPFEETNSNADYESIIPTKHLYYDPNPEIIRKSTTTNPVVYNQNIMVRFLQPPPVPLGPLIIREVRPPQPQPSSPLVSLNLVQSI